MLVGYTITLSFDNYKVSYCHCDPNFIVTVGDTVKQGQVIGHVGPKNVYGVKGNQYYDEQGNPTNGATTRLSSTFGISNQWAVCKSCKLFIKSKNVIEKSRHFRLFFISVFLCIFMFL